MEEGEILESLESSTVSGMEQAFNKAQSNFLAHVRAKREGRLTDLT